METCTRLYVFINVFLDFLAYSLSPDIEAPKRLAFLYNREVKDMFAMLFNHLLPFSLFMDIFSVCDFDKHGLSYYFIPSMTGNILFYSFLCVLSNKGIIFCCYLHFFTCL